MFLGDSHVLNPSLSSTLMSKARRVFSLKRPPNTQRRRGSPSSILFSVPRIRLAARLDGAHRPRRRVSGSPTCTRTLLRALCSLPGCVVRAVHRGFDRRSPKAARRAPNRARPERGGCRPSAASFSSGSHTELRVSAPCPRPRRWPCCHPLPPPAGWFLLISCGLGSSPVLLTPVAPRVLPYPRCFLYTSERDLGGPDVWKRRGSLVYVRGSR